MRMSITVVIPVRNESSGLWATLSGLRAQTLAPLETILVDAGGNDGFLWARATGKSEGLLLRIAEAEGAYPGAARNVGVVAARGDWIAFLDCGIVPEVRWLEELAGNAAGGRKAVLGVTRYAPATAFQHSLCALSTGYSVIPVLPASLFHRSVFDCAGLFRADMRGGEDLEWIGRVRRKFGPLPAAYDALTTYWDMPGGFWTAARKWRLYAEHFVRGRVRIKQQVAYLTAVPLLALLTWVSWPLLFLALLGYLLVRVILRPIRLGARLSWLARPRNLVRTAFLAIILDLSKAAGFAVGWLREGPSHLSRASTSGMGR